MRARLGLGAAGVLVGVAALSWPISAETKGGGLDLPPESGGTEIETRPRSCGPTIVAIAKPGDDRGNDNIYAECQSEALPTFLIGVAALAGGGAALVMDRRTRPWSPTDSPRVADPD
jgi:hypothetical protein